MKYRGLLLPMILAAMCGDDAFVLNTKRGKECNLHIEEKRLSEQKKNLILMVLK